MDLAEKLRQFSQRVESLKDSISTEEAAKTSFIMPFFQLLGYDVFNPLEFVPEFVADVGIKKGEKVDYAIIIDGNPLILIECKSCGENLDRHGSQLFRYFGTTTAKFGILTNGIVYRFYTDLEDKNKMDAKPFLTIDLLDLNDRDISEISKFSKEKLDVDTILNSASDLMYSRLIREWFSRELENPSIDLVKLALNNVYEGIKNQKTIEKFAPLIKRSMSQYINDSMNTKIKSALNKEVEAENTEDALERNEQSISRDSEPISKISTTIEELEAYAIVKAILRTAVESPRIAYRDTESYFGILLDDNNRKWICRIHITPTIKYITIADENKKPVRYDINSIDDIYNFAGEITASCKRYL